MDRELILECFDPDFMEYEDEEIEPAELETMTTAEILEMLDIDQLIERMDESLQSGDVDGFLTGGVQVEDGTALITLQYIIDIDDEEFDNFVHLVTEILETSKGVDAFINTLNSLIEKMNAKIQKGMKIDKGKNWMKIEI